MFSSNTSQVSSAANYIEDVFSTWLYTGNGANRSINNGIDLSTKGGLVWTKSRSNVADHALADTVRGNTKYLFSNGTLSEQTYSGEITSFNSNGYSLGNNASAGFTNVNTWTYASWTFRKQPKFFDIVTWTGDGNTSKTIAHSLGSVPGCIITKSTSGVNNWQTYHRSLGNTQAVQLNLTNAASTNTGFWNNTSPTATEFTVGTVENANGETYVAYLFAHNAGGFGLTGTDNVISCGSVTSSSVGALVSVTLGYEPQFLLIKQTTGTDNQGWYLVDTMRGLPAVNSGGGSNADASLFAQSSAAENSGYSIANINSTGFALAAQGAASSNQTFIYIAIRRGPMKTPTTGTSVFSPNAVTSGSVSTGFPVDSQWAAFRGSYAYNTTINDRLRGVSSTSTTTSGLGLITSNIDGEGGAAVSTLNWSNTGTALPGELSGASSIYWNFRRAPGFFDEVCYSGSSSNTTQTHNLGVVPEMIIVKSRNNSRGWPVYTSPTGAGNFLFLNSTDESAGASTYWNNTTPTASVFSLGTAANTNNSGDNYVAYLFATLAGVSKVGSYTGTGNTLQINCGFTGGARFVLIKRTDVAGAWYVWDSARGIVSGNDPYLLLNSTAAEVTTTDWVDAHSPGFELSNAAGNNVNINGGTFIFLAIA